MSLPTKILQAAMSSKHHVFVDYVPHVKGLRVYAYPSDTDYENNDRDRMISEVVYLDWDDADQKLATLLEMIEELES